MSRCYKYSVAQFRAHPIRDERLNVGIVIFDEGRLEVRLPKSLDKLRAISSAVDIDMVWSALTRLAEVDDFARDSGYLSVEQRLEQMRQLSSIHLSSVGSFYANSSELFENAVGQLIHKLVEPEPAPQRQQKKRPTRLLSAVRTAFKAERVLAKKGETLDAHRVVTNQQIAEGLSADFLLKNGAMHVIETVDASSDASLRRSVSDVAVSALVFEQARITFGESVTSSKLIYKATSDRESALSPALHAAEHQGAKLVNWESRDDRLRFIVEMSSLAEPIPDKKLRTHRNVTASTQPKLRLN